jgi:Protein of unknown function (DUF3606)
LAPIHSNKEEQMAAAKKTTARGRRQDRARVAGGQDYEVKYESKKTGRSASAVKKATERQECAIGVISETGKECECFKVGLLLLAIRTARRQFTFEKPNQVTRFMRVRAKHAEVKFVIGDDVIERIKAHESARGTQM